MNSFFSFIPSENKPLDTVYQFCSFSILWICSELIYSVICSQTNQLGQDEFFRFIFFLQNPTVIFLNIVAIIMVLFHSNYWVIEKIFLKKSNLMKSQIVNSYQKIFRLGFSLGEITAVICLPITIITLFMIAFGNVTQRTIILQLITNNFGKAILFFVITLPIWSALPRIFQFLNHFNIYLRRQEILAYFISLIWTAHGFYILFVR